MAVPVQAKPKSSQESGTKVSEQSANRLGFFESIDAQISRHRKRLDIGAFILGSLSLLGLGVVLSKAPPELLKAFLPF